MVMSTQIDSEGGSASVGARVTGDVQPCGPHHESHSMFLQHLDGVLHLLGPGVGTVRDKGHLRRILQTEQKILITIVCLEVEIAGVSVLEDPAIFFVLAGIEKGCAARGRLKISLPAGLDSNRWERQSQ